MVGKNLETIWTWLEMFILASFAIVFETNWFILFFLGFLKLCSSCIYAPLFNLNIVHFYCSTLISLAKGLSTLFSKEPVFILWFFFIYIFFLFYALYHFFACFCYSVIFLLATWLENLASLPSIFLFKDKLYLRQCISLCHVLSWGTFVVFTFKWSMML